MTDEEKASHQVHGRVKWFDVGKGFGFIISDEGGPDILLHANVLRNFGQSSVADGAGITVSIQQTQRGAQAVEVLGALVHPGGREKGFRVRLATGIELNVVREAGGFWYGDEDL